MEQSPRFIGQSVLSAMAGNLPLAGKANERPIQGRRGFVVNGKEGSKPAISPQGEQTAVLGKQLRPREWPRWAHSRRIALHLAKLDLDPSYQLSSMGWIEFS